eukprot:scaffold48198_cov78-Cyclotella_meneghiniana.AAC.7
MRSLSWCCYLLWCTAPSDAMPLLRYHSVLLGPSSILGWSGFSLDSVDTEEMLIPLYSLKTFWIAGLPGQVKS